MFPTDWSRDGRYIAFTWQGKGTGFDAWVLPTFGDRKPIAVLKTPFNEGGTVFSPDGRFIVYTSNESGRNEIYARSFPGPGGKWQVSADGGADPHFSADGKEIYYRAPDQKVMAVDVKIGAGFEAGVPKALFLGRFQPANARNRFVPVGRRPEVPDRRAAGPGRHGADDGGFELVRRTRPLSRVDSYRLAV